MFTVLSGPQVCLNRLSEPEVYVVAVNVRQEVCAVRIDGLTRVPAIGETIEKREYPNFRKTG